MGWELLLHPQCIVGEWWGGSCYFTHSAVLGSGGVGVATSPAVQCGGVVGWELLVHPQCSVGEWWCGSC